MLTRIAAGLAVMLVASVALLSWSLSTAGSAVIWRRSLPATGNRSTRSSARSARRFSVSDTSSGRRRRKVRIHRDRFRLINIRLADGRISTVQEFPAFAARRHQHHGVSRRDLRRRARVSCAGRTRSHLEYTMSVERSETPSSRTFVSPAPVGQGRAAVHREPPWQEGYNSSGGSVPEQLFGDLEVIVAARRRAAPVRDRRAEKEAPNGARAGRHAGLPQEIRRWLYRREHGRVFASRRHRAHADDDADLQADLVAKGKARGLNEGAAMLEANKRMEDLGYYPKSPTITAQSGVVRAACRRCSTSRTRSSGSASSRTSSARFSIPARPKIERRHLRAPSGLRHQREDQRVSERAPGRNVLRRRARRLLAACGQVLRLDDDRSRG